MINFESVHPTVRISSPSDVGAFFTLVRIDPVKKNDPYVEGAYVPLRHLRDK